MCSTFRKYLIKEKHMKNKLNSWWLMFVVFISDLNSIDNKSVHKYAHIRRRKITINCLLNCFFLSWVVREKGREREKENKQKWKTNNELNSRGKFMRFLLFEATFFTKTITIIEWGWKTFAENELKVLKCKAKSGCEKTVR